MRVRLKTRVHLKTYDGFDRTNSQLTRGRSESIERFKSIDRIDRTLQIDRKVIFGHVISISLAHPKLNA
jgi:hypothetical protein